MYRDYENPYRLERKVRELSEYYRKRVEAGASEYELDGLHFELENLRERENFAWQDDETY